MNVVKQNGNAIGALAIVTIDNPMAAGTGHRICNDCMKSCIFQKQDPVDIPQVETRTLKDVLELPWGFEIYSLLTRWNPLNFARPLPQRGDAATRCWWSGSDPAGFTLAHHLMNDGHTVAAIDGLKIEPLPADDFAASTPLGERVPFRPIRDVTRSVRIARRPRDGGLRRRGRVRHHRPLEQELPQDHSAAARTPRASSRMFGGVRFGGTLTVDDAFAAGLRSRRALHGRRPPDRHPDEERPGARRAPGVRLPDGAAADRRREDETRVANLQIRMPIVVIGGGLTAIDTATESLAYYVVQVEKFLERYEHSGCRERARPRCAPCWTQEESRDRGRVPGARAGHPRRARCRRRGKAATRS